jgi:hypothetical protein
MASDPGSSEKRVEFHQVDLPELKETFADSINSMVFDGQTLRITFGVTRMTQTGEESAAYRYPACRLVLTPGAANEMIRQLQQFSTRLTESGVLRPAAPTPKEAN